MIVVFDIGNVLLRWDPRNLYRKVFGDEATMERFLETALARDFILETDIEPDFTAAIERRARRHADDCGAAVRLVLSGGHAPALSPHLTAGGPIAAVAPEPDLVLRGLWHRARAERGPVAGARAAPARLDGSLR